MTKTRPLKYIRTRKGNIKCLAAYQVWRGKTFLGWAFKRNENSWWVLPSGHAEPPRNTPWPTYKTRDEAAATLPTP